MLVIVDVACFMFVAKGQCECEAIVQNVWVSNGIFLAVFIIIILMILNIFLKKGQRIKLLFIQLPVLLIVIFLSLVVTLDG